MTKIKKNVKKRFYIYELGIEIPSAHCDEPPPAAVSWERRTALSPTTTALADRAGVAR